MPERSLRFGVTDGKGHRAATWKCWTQAGTGKHDVYLACRQLGGTLKTSLHQSGQWHTGYCPRFYASAFPEGAKPKSRYIDEWQKPKEITAGLILAYRIITPSGAATIPLDESKHNLITWVPTCQPGNATEIAILISTHTYSSDNWPGKQSMGTKLVGTLHLDSGETVYVIYSVIKNPSFESKSIPINFFKGRSHTDLEEGKLRMLIFGGHEDGSRVFYDYPVNVAKANRSI